MPDDENNFSAGDWIGKASGSGRESFFSVYLRDPQVPRVSFVVKDARVVVLQLFDDRWSRPSTEMFRLSAAIDDHPIVGLTGHCLAPGLVMAGLADWPAFPDQIQSALSLRVRSNDFTTEMPVAGAHAAIAEALTRLAALSGR